MWGKGIFVSLPQGDTSGFANPEEYSNGHLPLLNLAAVLGHQIGMPNCTPQSLKQNYLSFELKHPLTFITVFDTI